MTDTSSRVETRTASPGTDARVPAELPLLGGRKGPHKDVERGCRRSAGCGCVALVVVVALVLSGEYLLLKRGFGRLADDAAQRLTSTVAFEVGPGPRDRLQAALTDYAVLRRSAEGERRDRLTLAFLGRAADALQDNRVTAEEIDALVAWMESALERGDVEPAEP